MRRSRGKRFDDTPRLNIKKVIATIIAIIVFIMIIISLKNILTTEDDTNDVSILTTYISVLENNKWGVIDNKGNKVIETNYDEMIIVPDKNKDIFICTYDVDYNTENFKTKVLNKDGKEILTEYNLVQAIENTDGNNVWYENNVLKFEENGKFGLINFDGKEILSPEYDNIYALTGLEKSLIIEKDGKKGLVNTSMGEIIIPVEYADITNLDENYEAGYIVKNDSNKYGIISADKSKILDTKYDEIRKVSGNGYYVVVENGALEVIDKSGNIILNSGFDSIESINVDNFIITKSGKYGMINKSGEEVIKPEYDILKFAFSNTFIAQKDGKYGIINNSANTLVNFNYDLITYIDEADFFECENSDHTTDIYDRNFNRELENIIISELNLENGYLRIRQDNDYKYYNFKFEEKSNKEILTTNTLFLIKENGKYGYENKKGERIVDCIYDDAKEQNEFGFCAVKKDGLWGCLKSDGTIVVEPSRNLDEYLFVDFISEWNRYNDLSLNVYTK